MARNDVYLSLCLEQASLSPLHYRHGCIVVRGGKVIGKGYNDYRSGFNGGAQSTGQLSSAGASNTLRAKKIEKHVPSDGRDHPARTRGEGALSNTPLSMHSEMMAINSALSLSAAIACQGTARSTQWLQKPCFKLSARSKRRSRLQHLKAYADVVYRVPEEQTTAEELRGGSHVQESRFEASPSQLSAALSQPHSQRDGRGGGEGRQRVDTSDSQRQQCPPPRSARLSEGSEVQFSESAAAYERRQRETPEAVPVRPVRWCSVSSARPSRQITASDTSTPTTETTAEI